jgi:Putative zinc-finger
MRHSAIRSLLVDFHEGAISAEEKRRVEEHLASCPACKAFSENIGSTLNVLHNESPRDVPVHYFATLLPQVRSRIEERSRPLKWFSPAPWVYRCLAPVSSGMVVAALIGLFLAFRPSASFVSPLEELRSEAATQGTRAVADYLIESSDLTYPLESSQKVRDIVADPSLISSRMADQIFDNAPENYQPVSLIVTDEVSVDDIPQEDLNQVIAQLSNMKSL